jgi:flagellar motility protein MotE (MotC chaperone)
MPCIGGGTVLKIKDIIALGALAIVSFPMVLLGVLLWTGNVRLVFGPESQDPNARGRLLERPEDIPGATKAPESGKAAPGQTDSAMMARTADLDRREAEAMRESQRLQMVQQDDQKIREAIHDERERLEAILGKGDSLENARTTVLASTFSLMKPDQAAKILLSLDDVLTTAVLRKVTDDKPRAKILAAMGKLDVQRTARVSRLLVSAPPELKKSSEAPKDAGAKKETPPTSPKKAPAANAEKKP